MTPRVLRALKALDGKTKRRGKSLANPSDKEMAVEMFIRLRDKGEILLAGEITEFANAAGWSEEEASELGALGQQIGNGATPRIGMRHWSDDFFD